jgi:hypothetical protein
MYYLGTIKNAGGESTCEREMCPWAISSIFWRLSAQHIIKWVIMCQMMNEVQINKKVWF